MMERIFLLCVAILLWMAKLLGTTYEAVNVWFFCVIWPAFTLVLIAIVIWQRWEIVQLTMK